MKTIAIIPARGESKGIKLKNIRDLCGKPLIYYQLKNALDSHLIDKVVLASDSNKILNIGQNLFGNKITLVKRTPEISTDNSKTEDTLKYVLGKLEETFDLVVTLEPTNPLNRTENIDICIKKMQLNSDLDAMCCAVFDYDFRIGNAEDTRFLLRRPMKKDIHPKIKERGACWVTKIKSLQKYNNRLGLFFDYLIIPEEDGFHIDSISDWMMIEVLMRQRLLKSPNRYYKTRRNRNEKDKFDLRYWKKVKDPDGIIRDKTKERKKRIESCKEELDYINNLKPGKILDVGCGLGFLLSGINSKWEKHGVEISEYGANYAKQYGKVLCGVLQAAEYKSDSFDAVLCYHVIEHMKNPIDELIEIKRILKPGGKLILGMPDFECGIAQRFGDNFRLLQDQTHISLFSTFSILKLLNDLLFEVENISFPFFNTEYFTKDNLLRLFDTSKVSPPFYGSFVTLYAYKK